MRVYNRPFDEMQNDFQRMWQFIVEDNASKKDQFIWQIGRLGDWKYGIWSQSKFFPSFMRKNAQLWLNNFHELVGFIISENCDNGFFTFAKRGYEFLYSEMLDWVVNNWSEREGKLSTEVHEYQTDTIRVLEEKGFQVNGQIATTRQYNLFEHVDQEVVLPEGFRIIDMGLNPDFEGKKILHNNGFNNKNTLDTFDLLQFEYARESPCYNPFYDLSVVDQNGTHLSTCTAFVDYANNVAEIEKVCTHSEHRQRGFAEAVIRECFKRLNTEGIEYAYITGYSEKANNLYEKLGVAKRRNWFEYTLHREQDR